ncbi:MAG: GAF domain-containing protein [Gemmatimonadaceae bacterium]
MLAHAARPRAGHPVSRGGARARAEHRPRPAHPQRKGVAGIVAMSREPLLVQDAAEADRHPLLRDQYLTTGSFISFPLIYRDELIGVVNLTNRAKRGVFVEEDVERVSLLALVIALIAANADLPVRLLGEIGGE